MSDPNGDNRPVRSRAAVLTYNLKVLSDTAQHTRESFQEDVRNHTPVPRDNMSSPLSSPMTSISTPSELGSPPQSARDYTTLRDPKYECFNHVANTNSHYYSAPTLCARGVWIGYLAFDRQKKSYRGLPSFSELKKNFVDMSLPWPPSNPGSAAKARAAVCRACLREDSALLRLRELSFAKNRSLVIMPLDGDDEMGTFCILLPQPMDRSMKNLQVWRPYEVKNCGDGSKFDNKFFLFTLRYTDHDTGTLETVIATLRPQGYDCNATRPASRANITSLTAELASSAAEESDEFILPVHRHRESQPRNAINDSKLSSQGNKRKREGVTVLQISKRMHSRLDNSKPSPSVEDPMPTLSTSDTSGHHQPLTSGDTTTQTALSDSSMHGDLQNIDIVWNLDLDGEECDFPLTMAKCKSFSELLEAMHGMARYLPPAAEVLEKTTLWRLTYTLPSGTKKTQMALKGTEVAFNRMQGDLRQARLSTDERLDVGIRAIG